jgi:nucleotide-binding universal stress UspA family protein
VCAFTEWLVQKTEAVVDVLHVCDAKFLGDVVGLDWGEDYACAHRALCSQIKIVAEKGMKIVKKNVEKFFHNADLIGRIQFYYRTGELVDVYREFENSNLGLDLVVLGKRGSHYRRAAEHVGSSTERIVRAGTKPCLVCPDHFGAIRRQLIAYDGSVDVHRAVQFLARTKKMNDVEIHLVCVIPSSEVNRDRWMGVYGAEEMLASVGYRCRSRVLVGDTEELISHYVDEEKIDLLTIGACDNVSPRPLAVDGTSMNLLRRCPVAVLLFR